MVSAGRCSDRPEDDSVIDRKMTEVAIVIDRKMLEASVIDRKMLDASFRSERPDVAKGGLIDIQASYTCAGGCRGAGASKPFELLQRV